jgi:hypothetical protein
MADEWTALYQNAEVALFDINRDRVSEWHQIGDDIPVTLTSESTHVTLRYAGYRRGEGEAEFYLDLVPRCATQGHVISGIPAPMFSRS